MFAFTSIGVIIDNEINHRLGSCVFRINGQNHHRMGSLLPVEGGRPKFAQLYIYDPQHANDLHFQGNPNLDHQVMATLHDVLWNHHPYICLYKRAHDVMMELPVGQSKVTLY